MLTIAAVAILVSLIYAPLGCLVLWKRYVYFGEGLAHASILAIAISVVADLPMVYAAIISLVFFALLVYKINIYEDSNAAVGFTSSFMVASALAISSIFPGKFNFSRMLFGDIISANNSDIPMLILILIIIALYFFIFFRSLIITTLSKDIAYTKGIRVRILELIFMLILAFSIVSTMKIVGALLITSMILIPAMTSRIVSRTPKSMIWNAIFFALMMNSLGMYISLKYDIPYTPVVIVIGGVIYLIMQIIKQKITSFK